MPIPEAQCHDAIATACSQAVANLGYDGNIVFDRTAANACLAALLAPETRCDADAPQWLTACAHGAWHGSVALGGGCQHDLACADPGAYCASDDTCTPLAVQGGACSLSLPCAAGLYCDEATATCLAWLAAGDPCTGDARCTSNRCSSGTCAMSGSACSGFCTSQCASGPYAGQTCSTDQDCYGHCSVTTSMTCYNETSCPPSETCEHYSCAKDTCTGQTCAPASYCTVGTNDWDVALSGVR